MNWKKKKLKDSQIEIQFELTPEEFKKFEKKVILDFKKDLEIKGFRKGKAPREIVLDKIGREKILKESAKLAIEETYFRYLKEEKIEPISTPQAQVLKLAPKNPFVFKVLLQVLPEFELPDYKKIAKIVKRRKVSVSKEEIDDVIKQIQFSRANLSLRDRPAKKEDFVEIEYSCPEIEGGREFKDSFILGKGFFIPGFEEKLVKMKAGQEKKFSLKFPKNRSQKSLAGKDLTFRVKMKAVKKVELPELTDDFAKSLGKFKDLNSLRESINQGLKVEKEIWETQRMRKEVLEKIRENCEISLPSSLIEKERDFLKEDFKNRIPKGISFKGFLKRIKKTKEQLSNSLLNVAKNRIENSLIVKAITKKEGIQVTEDEIKERVNKRIEKFPPGKTKNIDIEKLKAYTRGEIIREKVFQILENVQKPNHSQNS